jgi:hypothetical protein
MYPVALIPKGFDSARIIAHDLSDGFMTKDLLLVLVTAEAKPGEIHLVYHPDNARTTLEYVDQLPGNRLQFRSTTSGFASDINISEVDFGKTDAFTRLTVIGPVVARTVWEYGRDRPH